MSKTKKQLSSAALKPMGIAPKDNLEFGRVIAILCIGVCDAIIAGAMTIDSAERYLFNPYTLNELHRRGFGEEVTDLIHLGTELSNVGRLLPTKLEDSIAQIKRLALEFLKRYHSSPDETWVGWLMPIDS